MINIIKHRNYHLVDTYILASKGISLVSRLIRKYQRGFEYTHIAYVLDFKSNPNNPYVIEAWHLPIKLRKEKKEIKIFNKRILTIEKPKLQFGGVFKRHFKESHTKGTHFSIFRVKTTLEQKERIEEFLFRQVERTQKGLVEYDFKGFFGFILFADEFEDKNKWFCSELVFYAYKQAGIDLLKNIEHYKVSPRLLLLSPLLEKVYDGILE